MEPKNWIGLLILVVGVILQPIGYIYIFWLQAVSFILIFIGVFILLIQRHIKVSEDKEFRSYFGGSGMPGDIFGSNGWETGGRSDSWHSLESSDGTEHGDGD